MKRFTRTVAAAAACLALSLAVIAPAEAATRQVVYENFTATWCGYCPPVGRALNDLFGDFPDDVIPIQIRLSDGYETAWGNTRANFYGVGGIPDTYGDGIYRRLGGGDQAQIYNQFNTWRSIRMGVATDVTIDVQVQHVSGQTYNIVAEVGIEAGGVGKQMAVHFVNTLRDYPPAGDGRNPNCVRGGWNKGIHTLTAGNSVVIQQQVTFDSASWNKKDDIGIIVFAQEPGTGQGREIYNARMVSYPFTTPCAGDVTGDGTTGHADLASLLSAYGSCAGDPNWNPAADLDGSGCVGHSDLALLLSDYGCGT